MSSFHQTRALQGLLEQVAERIKDHPQGRAYLSPDGRAYVLAADGPGAQAMDDFMRAVGHYFTKMKHGRGDQEAAKAEWLRMFDEWLSQQKI